MRYGLLGEKLGHSFSPAIHAQLAAYTYELFEVEPGDVARFLTRRDIGGLNVTIPYKQTVLPHLDEVSDIAERIGSVNTIVFRKDGTKYGHNTDYDGFLYLADTLGVPLKGKKIAVLGSGGTAKTVQVACADIGASEVITLSRKGGKGYADLSTHKDAQILINTTPVGMYPQNLKAPVDIDVFYRLEGVIDVVYNPLRTQLVLDAVARDIPAVGGLAMLVAQAAAAAQYFTGKPIEGAKVAQICNGMHQDATNIVLIGMPGSGKSCIGKAVAKRLGRKFIDLDRQIAHRRGKSIPDIFSEDGEPAFRALEHQVVKEYGAKTGLVIATGGGAVVDMGNYAPLAQNGRIYQIHRNINQLAIDGRPISAGAAHLTELYKARAPQYAHFRDASVYNRVSVEATAKQICEDFYETTCD